MNIQSSTEQTEKSTLLKLADMLKNIGMITRIAMSVDKTIVVYFLFATFIGTVFQVASSGAYALTWEQLTKAASLHYVTTGLLWAIGFMALVNLLPAFTGTVRRSMEQRFNLRLMNAYETVQLKKYIELDPARLERPEFHDLAQKARDRGAGCLQQLFKGQFRLLGAFAGMIAAIIVLGALGQWLLIIMILVGAVPALLAQVRYSNDIWSIHDAEAPVKRRFYELRHKLSNPKCLTELALFQNGAHLLKKLTDLLETFTMSQRRSQSKALYATLSANLIEESTLVLGAAVIIVNGIYGNWKVSAIIFAISSVRQLQNSLESVRDSYGDLYENSLFATNVREFLEVRPLIPRRTDGLRLPRGKVPTLELDKVTFTYEGSKVPVITDLSLVVHPGQIVGLVGENGAGKTTLTNLIAGIYEPTHGRIMLDGIDLREYDIETWRAELGVMTQMYMQYNFPVEDVIALGRTSVPHDQGRVLEAAGRSRASRFVEELPEQYRQQLGAEFRNGKDLSRGQNQLLALARIFYRQAGFIILDEPTAAASATAEAAIFDTIYQSRGKSSAIIISHNFANVMKADKICVVHGGKIAEHGTHQELMYANGLYAKSFRLQAERFGD